MRKCTSCNSDIPDDALKCHRCGLEFTQTVRHVPVWFIVMISAIACVGIFLVSYQVSVNRYRAESAPVFYSSVNPTPTRITPQDTAVTEKTQEAKRLPEINFNYVIFEERSANYANVKRMVYSVYLPEDINRDDIEPTLQYIGLQKSKEDPDIDALTVFAYIKRIHEDPEWGVGGEEAMAYVNWAPYGEWGDAEDTVDHSTNSFRYTDNVKAYYDYYNLWKKK